MGQSFLTHDEKSSGSPSPDLLQFNGVSSNPKFFGSLSSVKESSIASSPLLESVDSDERNLGGTPSSSSSPLSPTNTASSDLYSSLMPTPILPGNVNRLREKFMGVDKDKGKDITSETGGNTVFRREHAFGKEAISDLDCRFISRPATTSPGSIERRSSSGGTMTIPIPSRRYRSSLHALSPASSGHHHTIRRRTLPPPASTYDDKLNSIKPDNNDWSECFKRMTLVGSASNNNMGNFTNETPLVRRRPRTRPYVPQPRSVIIRAGYLPVVQTVDVIPSRSARASASASEVGSPSSRQEPDAANKCNSECATTATTTTTRTSLPQIPTRKEDVLLVSSPHPSSSRRLEAERKPRVVTNQEDHTKKKVLRKDAEVNTSAEVLVLPKGTKTSVLLKSGIIDEVDGVKSLKRRRRRKKRGIGRVARVFGRIMIRLVELF